MTTIGRKTNKAVIVELLRDIWFATEVLLSGAYLEEYTGVGAENGTSERHEIGNIWVKLPGTARYCILGPEEYRIVSIDLTQQSLC